MNANLRDEFDDANKQIDVESHEDRTREFKKTSFSRMRTDWTGPDKLQIQALHEIVEGQILKLFSSAFVIMNDIYDVVREYDVNEETGEVRVDRYGRYIWKRSDSGAYLEDYSKMGIKEKENFIFQISTHLFEWEQQAAMLWGDSMFAKAIWEQHVSEGFAEQKGTVEARVHGGKLTSTEDRYHAIFVTLISRRGDAVVRTMDRLHYVIKHSITK